MRDRSAAWRKLERLRSSDNGIVGIWTYLGAGGNHTCTIQFERGQMVRGWSDTNLMEAVAAAEQQWRREKKR